MVFLFMLPKELGWIYYTIIAWFVYIIFCLVLKLWILKRNIKWIIFGKIFEVFFYVIFLFFVSI